MDDVNARAARLDPASADDVTAIRELLENLRHREWPSDEFLDAVAQRSPSRVLRGEARLTQGMQAQERRDYERAERHYIAGLEPAWDSGGLIELRAVTNYAMFCVAQQRPLEALLLSRRCVDLASGCSALEEAIGRMDHAAALSQLGDWEGALAVLDEAEERIEELPEERRRVALLTFLGYRIPVAYELGDAATATRCFERLERVRVGPGPGFPPDALLGMRAQVAFVTGRFEEAVQWAQQLRRGHPTWDPGAADADLVEVRSLVALGQLEPAVAAADALVGRLEAEPGRALPPGTRLETARVLAREIDVHDPDVARRALNVAAAAAIDRIWQADRFRRVEGFTWLSPEDRRIIDEYQARFVSEYADVLDHLAGLLTRPEPFELVAAEPTDDRLICVCAWCRRVRGPQGVWLDIDRFPVLEEAVAVTHGACASCVEAVTSSF